MEKLHQLMTNAFSQNQNNIQKLQAQIADSLQGNLIIESNKSSLQFYCSTGSTCRRYLSKTKQQYEITQLLQKKYDEKCLKLLTQRQNAIAAFLKRDPHDTFDEIWNDFPTECQKKLIPFKESTARRLDLWKRKIFNQKPLVPGIKTFKTINGETVRSKSEKIIADLLYYYNVPYRYEMACTLNELGTIYPDFTIYDIRKNRLVYLEHFGMIDNPDYSKKMIIRYNDYIKSGFADRLIISMESSTQPLNVKALIPLIKPYSLNKADDMID